MHKRFDKFAEFFRDGPLPAFSRLRFFTFDDDKYVRVCRKEKRWRNFSRIFAGQCMRVEDQENAHRFGKATA